MTQRTPPLDEADLDLLSAYIDDQLSATERLTLEERLGREPELRQALDELRSTVYVLHTLPQVTPPRSFTLDLSVAPARPWYSWLTPGLLRFGSTLAAVLLVISFIPDILGGLAGNMRLGSAPAASAPTSAAAYSPAAGGSADMAAMPTPNMEMQRQMTEPSAADLLSATTGPAAPAAAATLASADPATIATTAEATLAPAATPASAAQPPLADNPANPAAAVIPSDPQPKAGDEPAAGSQDSATGSAPIATSGSSSPGTALLDRPPEAPPQMFSQPQPDQQVSPWTILRIILVIAVLGLGLASWRLRREA